MLCRAKLRYVLEFFTRSGEILFGLLVFMAEFVYLVLDHLKQITVMGIMVYADVQGFAHVFIIRIGIEVGIDKKTPP